MSINFVTVLPEEKQPVSSNRQAPVVDPLIKLFVHLLAPHFSHRLFSLYHLRISQHRYFYSSSY